MTDREPRSRALLVGCNYAGTDAALSGCINDVHNMKKILITKFGFDKTEIRVLTDDKTGTTNSTRANIISNIKWLVKDAQAGDSLMFHFSGHGTQMEDADKDEVDGMDEAICPTDYEVADLIGDDELNALLVKPLPEGCTLFGVMDCCHSGTGLDLPFTLEGTTVTKTSKKKPSSLANVVLVSGCQDAQCSTDLGSSDPGASGGALTCSIRDWLDKKEDITWASLLETMQQELKQWNQRPNMTLNRDDFDIHAPFSFKIPEVEQEYDEAADEAEEVEYEDEAEEEEEHEESDVWTYSGSLETDDATVEITLSIYYNEEDNTVTGTMTEDGGEETTISGTYTEKKISFVQKKGKQSVSFSGKLKEESTEIVGKWSLDKKNKGTFQATYSGEEEEGEGEEEGSEEEEAEEE